MKRTDPERLLEYGRRYRRKKKAEKLEKRRLRINARALKRHALKKNAPGTFTPEEWLKLLEFYGGKCLACGTAKDISIDHVVPLSKGGSNDITNLQPLCKPCNSSKGVKTTDYRTAFPYFFANGANHAD
jgi:5-methylcytosine-specific restriction endonuclease McrA